jgi:hypothetical protein
MTKQKVLLRTIAIGSACLFTSASYAQINGDPAATEWNWESTVPSGNAAAASMQRTLARAVMAEFSLADFVADANQTPANPQPQTTPPAGSNPAPPSLGDLGFPPTQTQANPQEQARLDRRSHMLKMHQRLGLITTIPLLATVIAGSFAGGRTMSSTARDLHTALGSVTADLYFTTAYYSIFAPKIAGTQSRGPIRLHKALAWIHGPGMILTPILGALAFDQKSRGEKVHGIASAHGAVAYVTAAAYGLAIASVSFRF